MKEYLFKMNARQVKAKLIHDGLLSLSQCLCVPWITIWNPCRQLDLNNLHNSQ